MTATIASNNSYGVTWAKTAPFCKKKLKPPSAFKSHMYKIVLSSARSTCYERKAYGYRNMSFFNVYICFDVIVSHYYSYDDTLK